MDEQHEAQKALEELHRRNPDYTPVPGEPWHLVASARTIRFDVQRGLIRHVGECLACGHDMPLVLWNERDRSIGLCEPCRDAAASLRGACSEERGCFCGPDKTPASESQGEGG